MTKRIYHIIAVTAVFILGACDMQTDTEVTGSGNKGIHKVFTATIEDGDMSTKTYIDAALVDGSRALFWDTDDEIGVCTYGNTYQKFKNINSETSVNGMFEGTLDDTDDIYYAIYPYRDNFTMSSTQLVNLPSVQLYRANSFDRNAALMVGKGNDGETIHFQNLCGVLAINLTGTETIKNIIFKANDKDGNPAKVAGKCSYSMNYTTFPYLLTTDESTYSVTLDCGDGVTLDSSVPTSFHFVLPAATYNGFSLTFTTSDGGIITKETSKQLVIKRSIITNAATLDFTYNRLSISVTDITTTTASLSATTTSNETDVTDYGFIYGTNSDIDIHNGNVITSSETNSFTASLSNLTSFTRYFARAYITTGFGTSYSEIISFYTQYDGTVIELDKSGTANCYIVPPIGGATCCFKCTTKGNSSESVGNPDHAELVWETKNTDEALNVGDVISDVIYIDNRIFITLPENAVSGNALVAIKDAEENILWSWHIWVTDYDIEGTAQTYQNGTVVMDRNIGALNVDHNDVLSFGLFYQYGRKDPFIGCGNTSSWTFASTAPIDIIRYENNGSDEFAVLNPNVTTTGMSSEWSLEKSIHDPCPFGWKVPNESIWEEFLISNRSELTYGYLFSTTSSVPELYYPCTGDTENGTQRLRNPGISCYMWSTKNGYAYDMRTLSSVSRSRFDENPVRCMKDE